jgi:predicted dehydrogenase
VTGPVRIGIVGCGFVARERHLPAIARVPEAVVTALADLEPGPLDELGRRSGVRSLHREPLELTRDPAVDAVAVCVPAAGHVDVALAALETGRHVLVEKPLALSLADADRLIEAAAASAGKAIVGFNLRWHRLVRDAQRLLEAGAIGRIHAVHTVYSDPISRRPGLPQWRRDRRLGGGSVLEKGVHHFDLVRLLLRDELAEVHARSAGARGDDESVAISGETKGGTLVTSLVMDSTTVGNTLTFFGEEGSLHLDLYRSDGLELRALSELPGAPAARLRRAAAAASQLAANVREVRAGGAFDSSYVHEWRHVAAVVRGEAEPECTLTDGRAAIEIAFAVLASASCGAPVRVSEAPDGVAALASRESA